MRTKVEKKLTHAKLGLNDKIKKKSKLYKRSKEKKLKTKRT
jgi:hypothetical protein